MAPAALDGASLDDFGHLPLVGAEGKIRLGRPVNIVQHPAGARKQVVFRESMLSALPETLRTMAHYTGDTKPGSSGSPVFSDAWEVVALHHSGVPDTNEAGDWLDVDGKVWDETSDPEWERVKWIANEGIRVSSLVARVRHLAADATRNGARAPRAGARGGRGGRAPTASSRRRSRRRRSPPRRAGDRGSRRRGARRGAGAGSVSVQVPLTVTITVGAPRSRDHVSGAGRRRERDGGRLRRPPGLRSRLPRPARRAPDAPEHDRGQCGDARRLPETEFRYDHFSVLMNRSRRLAYVSAGNLRIDAPFNAPRRDPWGYDPRLHESLQAGNEFYAANDLDRGHLFRRADGAWGESEAEARRASDDTFHWTNIAPQHFIFNQGDRDPELSLWGLLENHVMEEAERKRQRVNVFNGPVFPDDDPSHRGLQVPRAYWKVLSQSSTARRNSAPSASSSARRN